MNGPGLTLELKQQLRLNMQLLQTMDILALSNEELKEKIKKEAETNPTLIVKDHTESFNTLSNIYRDTTDKRESYSDNTPYIPDNPNDEDRPNWIEGTISKKESLSEHLLYQLGCLDINEDIKRVAETIITGLDRNGFTGENPEKLLEEKDRPYLEEALGIVQGLEPSGIGAKDWQDSLILQLKDKGASQQELKLFQKLIYKELDNIKSGKLDLIARDLKTDREDVESMLSLIKTLTPFPGLAYGSDYDNYITPELSIKKVDGKLTMSLNKDALPIVEIDPTYEDMQQQLKQSKETKDKEAIKYLKDKLNSATMLINQINARTSTLERTGKVLMEKQRDFFLYGPLYLKGLTMKEVADEVAVHEATISRVASSKYIDTDFGIFPIRYMFSSKTRSENGEDVSKNAIKEMLRKMIEENTGKALSDQKLSDMLSEKGINIARRTVSKYRKELNIDSSFERKN